MKQLCLFLSISFLVGLHAAYLLYILRLIRLMLDLQNVYRSFWYLLIYVASAQQKIASSKYVRWDFNKNFPFLRSFNSKPAVRKEVYRTRLCQLKYTEM